MPLDEGPLPSPGRPLAIEPLLNTSFGDDNPRQSYPLAELENGQIYSSEGFEDRPFKIHTSSELDENERESVDEELLRHGTSARSSSWLRRYATSSSSIPAAVKAWMNGPVPPRPYTIEPYFRDIQMAPTHLLESYLGKRRHATWLLPGLTWLLIAFCFLWILLFSLLLHRSIIGTSIPSYENPVRLACSTRLWSNSTNCGLDGNDCLPFDNSSFAFVCPAGCQSVQVLEPYAIGAEEVNYRSLVIGGPSSVEGEDRNIYRGDSYVCGAALHAGMISEGRGGCGIVSRIGEQSNYTSVRAYGTSSIGFPSHFPLSFTFAPEGITSICTDMRWPLLLISVLFTSLLSIFTTSSAVFFGLTFACVFFQVGLASDPPYFADYDNVVSITFGRFLPAAFIGFVIYRYCIRYALRDLNAPLEKAFLWLGGCWVGALNKYTFDRIPLSRLTPHDLRQQPGAITALIFIVLLILIIALSQAWAFRIEGRMPRYLVVYALIILLIVSLLLVPHMNLRIHHYILALVLLPGTALQTRPSLLYQGILVGLFINGVARWGFDSILQTPSALLSGAQLGSLLPDITAPTINNGTITFAFSKLAENFDGISALVNDVERFRGIGAKDGDVFTWTRRGTREPEFFRFGYLKLGELSETWWGDFTKAGTWEADGSWVHMEPGPS